MYLQRLSNGSIDPDSEVQRVIELQEAIDKQNSEVRFKTFTLHIMLTPCHLSENRSKYTTLVIVSLSVNPIYPHNVYPYRPCVLEWTYASVDYLILSI